MVLEEIALQKNLANEWIFCQRESALSRFHHFFAISEFPFLMWRFVRQRVLKFAFAWSADFASRYRCELWMHFYQGPVKLGLQLCRICGIVRCSDKSQLALVCSDVFIFLSSAAAEVVFALSWTHKLENIVIHSHSIEPSERGPWVWFFSFDAIPEVSDSQISASCLQDWLSSAFFCRFWHILFFYPELRVYPERIMAEIWAALPLRGADPHREKVLLLGEVAGNWCWSVFLFVIGPSVIGLLKPKFGSFQLAHFSCLFEALTASTPLLFHSSMALVPFIADHSLQEMLWQLMLADRNLHVANEVLNTLLEIEEYLEDCAAPVALATLRSTITCHRRTIYQLAIWKLQKLMECQRALNEHFVRYHRAPLVDLELWKWSLSQLWAMKKCSLSLAAGQHVVG